MKQFTVVIVALVCVALLPARGRQEESGFTHDGISAVVIDAKTFAVDVEATGGRSVIMTVENAPDDLRVYHSVVGPRLRVWVEQEFSLFSRPHRGRLAVRVPRDVELAISSTTGAITVSGIDGPGVRVQTTTGSIVLSDLRGEAHVRSTTGRVEIAHSSGRYDVGTTTGSIRLTELDGSITASSSTGHQRYADVVGDIDARSTTGRIELDRTRGRVRLRTSTGNQTGSSVTLTANSSFQATTGSIDVDLTNDLADLAFDLTSTTGSLQVGRERSQRRLYLAGTGITVTGSTSTGSQRFF